MTKRDESSIKLTAAKEQILFSEPTKKKPSKTTINIKFIVFVHFIKCI